MGWDHMIMGVSTELFEEVLEYVADTSGVVVAAVRATKMDTIKVRLVRMPIEIRLEVFGKRMVGNKHFIF